MTPRHPNAKEPGRLAGLFLWLIDDLAAGVEAEAARAERHDLQ
jgi:hypothetical protein